MPGVGFPTRYRKIWKSPVKYIVSSYTSTEGNPTNFNPTNSSLNYWKVLLVLSSPESLKVHWTYDTYIRLCKIHTDVYNTHFKVSETGNATLPHFCSLHHIWYCTQLRSTANATKLTLSQKGFAGDVQYAKLNQLFGKNTRPTMSPASHGGNARACRHSFLPCSMDQEASF